MGLLGGVVLGNVTNPWTAGCCLAFLGSQLFRRHETFAISYHASILLILPTLLALCTNLLDSHTDVHSVASYHAAYLASLLMWTVLYRSSPLHPLAQYPGPFWCKTSKIWWGVLVLRGYNHYRLRALHEQYGDVVRIGPNELSIRNFEAVGPLLGTSGVPKSPGFIGSTLASGRRAADASLVSLVDIDEHLRRRRPWNRASSSAAVKEYKPMIAKRTSQLLEKLAQQEGVIALEKWLNYLSYDFMCDMAFGGGSELLRDGDVNNVWALLDQGVVFGAFFMHLPWLGPYIGSIPGGHRKKYASQRS